MKSREQELKDEIEEAENVNNEYYDSNSIEKLKAELKGLTDEKARWKKKIEELKEHDCPMINVDELLGDDK